VLILINLIILDIPYYIGELIFILEMAFIIACSVGIYTLRKEYLKATRFGVGYYLKRKAREEIERCASEVEMAVTQNLMGLSNGFDLADAIVISFRKFIGFFKNIKANILFLVQKSKKAAKTLLEKINIVIYFFEKLEKLFDFIENPYSIIAKLFLVRLIVIMIKKMVRKMLRILINSEIS